MKRYLNFLMVVMVLVGLMTGVATTASAQSALTQTTLSSAITSTRATTLIVASATGISASTNTQPYYLYIDRESMLITAISSTTVTVQRGQLGSFAATHASGAYVIFGAAGSSSVTGVTGGPFIAANPSGSCTRANNAVLPLINTTSGDWVNCNGGVWLVQTAPAVQGNLVGPCTVPIGSVAYGSFGTSTTASTTSQYTANVFVPRTILATGVTQLNGSAVDTASKKIVGLYSGANGGGAAVAAAKIANSATAGTAATGNDAFQAIPFTATVFVTGPANYLIILQDDTADVNGIRTVAASTFNNLVAGVTTSVFGTIPATVTAPTTFTADQGPIACLY